MIERPLMRRMNSNPCQRPVSVTKKAPTDAHRRSYFLNGALPSENRMRLRSNPPKGEVREPALVEEEIIRVTPLAKPIRRKGQNPILLLPSV
jgi:hypothetical protein